MKSTHNGHGGARVGAGRKPKSDAERAITGNPGRRGRLLEHPSAGQVPQLAPVDEFDAPDELTTDERNVWLKFAPMAFANGTLTRASAHGFVLLCQNVVLERAYRKSVAECGRTEHREAEKRVKGWMREYSLLPNGRRMFDGRAAVSAPVNKLDRFTKKAHA